MDQHAAMNDAGNFLIETCDETVSLDLKQQLLLMNGRWRDLFLKVKQVTKTWWKILYVRCSRVLSSHVKPVKCTVHVNFMVISVWSCCLLQYAHTDEMEKWRKDHLKAVSTLKELLDTAEAKLNAPVQVSFLNVRTFLHDVEVRKCLLVYCK